MTGFQNMPWDKSYKFSTLACRDKKLHPKSHEQSLSFLRIYGHYVGGVDWIILKILKDSPQNSETFVARLGTIEASLLCWHLQPLTT